MKKTNNDILATTPEYSKVRYGMTAIYARDRGLANTIIEDRGVNIQVIQLQWSFSKGLPARAGEFRRALVIVGRALG